MSKFHTTEFDFLPEQGFRRAVGRNSPATLEGGKGSSAPPPDPRLVDAQIRSMGIQDSAIKRVIEQSDEMLPLQREQLQLGLQTARTAYDQAQEDRGYALGKRSQLDSVQQPLVDEAKNFNESARREQMMQQADADVSSAFAVTRGQQTRALERMGVNPASGRFRSFGTQSGIGEAIARTEAGRKVSEAAKAEGLNLRTNAVNMLSGFPAMASGLTGSGFGFGTAGTGITTQAGAGMNAGFSTAGTMAGQMGANATGMFGAQANYKNGQDQIAANSDPFNTILGAATAVGTKALLASDRRLKTDIVPVGRMANGLPLYRFRYKAGGPYLIGVMADEVARIAPQAYVRGGAGNGYDAVDYGKL